MPFESQVPKRTRELALTPELFDATAAAAPPIVPEVIQKNEELVDTPRAMIARVKPCPIL
jgi:enoyl-CoA hydratase/carnithine racemase